MLQIKNIKKQYKTGGLIQKALDDVSLNLRDNEFVSILGPSGSGKTTLLNIIGGLDRYDDGDIIINNVSTKKYKDRDWDSYRAHTIGFVFQSYNLIPHQTILSNVELALTISGLSKNERSGRALKALEQVGLGAQAHKKPNQLSGGQMQRVAIARALVNDPDIVLADEPTGALDSETSVQVMELLKEVAKDRLVVMVTHNPELAEEYSTRIVKVKDGKIVADSNPYDLKKVSENFENRNLGKAGMSLWTSMSLSFNNLLSKKARTFLVSFAGSIGIIGIALIMALSNGANEYIHSIEENTLSEYPLTINKSSLDLTSMFVVGNDIMKTEDDGKVHEQQVIAGMFGTVKENDLGSLKKYLIQEDDVIKKYVNSIEYGYSVTPYIFKVHNEEVRQVSPDSVISSTGLSSFSSLMGGQYQSTFSALPDNPDLYINQYDILSGRWPENDHELVVVLNGANGLSDLALYNLWLKDPHELDNMILSYQNGEVGNAIEVGHSKSWDYEEIIGQEFKLMHASSLYKYDADLGFWSDRSKTVTIDDVDTLGETLTIVGIVRPSEDASNPMLTTGICYPRDLIFHIMDVAKNSKIVNEQLQDLEYNVLTGVRFDEEKKEFDMKDAFSFNEEALKDLFTFDIDSLKPSDMNFNDLNIDIGSTNIGDYIDFSSFSEVFGDLSQNAIQRAFDGVTVNITMDGLTSLFQELYDGFMIESEGVPELDLSKMPEAVNEYLKTQEAKDILKSAIQEGIKKAGESSSANMVSWQSTKDLFVDFYQYVIDNNLQGEDPEVVINGYLNTEHAASNIQAWSEAFSESMKAYFNSQEVISVMLAELSSSYEEYAKNNQMPIPSEIASAFILYLQKDESKEIIKSAANDMIDMDVLKQNLNGIASDVGAQIAGIIGSKIEAAMTSIAGKIAASIQSSIGNMMSSYMENLSSGFNFNISSLEDVIQFNMTADSLQTMFASMMSNTKTTANTNLKKFGYADIDSPESITFFPVDFESKNAIIDILHEYNDHMKEVDKDKVVSFSDVVGSLMSSVTSIIDIIGYVLIAFVAISLIVSSIMIGVITYISVLERRKEIGILRAMGASKANITQVFNCETMITGFLAGFFGIILTQIILFIGNPILQKATEQPDLHGFITIDTAIILVILSIVLTAIGGLIPSKGAAKQDPVIALRSE